MCTAPVATTTEQSAVTRKAYDEAYFDRWYRSRSDAVSSPAARRRKVALVVAVAEYYLGRPIRNVLDVGCGEGLWRAPFRALRPGVDYRGLDASEYAVARYGRSRHIGLVRLRELEWLRLDTRFDVIVCTNVLHYVGADEVRAGLAGIADMLEGVAFMETFTRGDEVVGDRADYVARPAARYLREFARVGLTPVGSHCYVGADLAARATALELAGHAPSR